MATIINAERATFMGRPLDLVKLFSRLPGASVLNAEGSNWIVLRSDLSAAQLREALAITPSPPGGTVGRNPDRNGQFS